MSLDVSQFSLNGDCGTFFDGQTVICTIDKKEYTVAFSFMAQISKSDFGIFYCVVVPTDFSAPAIHSGALGRLPLYILPAVYVVSKSKPASNEGSNSQGGASGEGSGSSQGGASGEGGGGDSGGQGSETQYV